jgi:ribosome-associated protein
MTPQLKDHMIPVTAQIQLPESEVQMEFIRASGPGGQNVNKVATAVQLRFDVFGSPSLPKDVRRRLLHLAGSRLTRDGVLVIDARRFRSQEKNRRDAVERLVRLIRRAAVAPKIRRRTRPTKASVRRRLNTKRLRGEIKRMRKRVPDNGYS